jgi:hypothetical protein
MDITLAQGFVLLFSFGVGTIFGMVISVRAAFANGIMFCLKLMAANQVIDAEDVQKMHKILDDLQEDKKK